MTMTMDSLNENDPLKLMRSNALCFPAPDDPFEASTSCEIYETQNIIASHNNRFSGKFSTPFLINSLSSALSPDSLAKISQNANYGYGGSTAYNLDSHRAPGPTSCVYLEMALKRLYSIEDFEFVESLGEGFFGNVHKVRHRVTDEVLVIKISKEREMDNRSSTKMRILKEVSVLNQLSHANLLAFRGVCVDLTDGLWNLHILVDYCDAGSLSRLILDTQKYFPWWLRCNLGRDIACAMDYVHSKDIMHRDLTSMNVLLQSIVAGGLKAVVADLGLSCKIPSCSEKLIQVGTPYWMAPECLNEEYYNEKADIFSFGIILCQMIARIDADPEAGLCRTHNFGLDYMRFTAHCPIDTPWDILKLAFRCCLMNPISRPTFFTIENCLKDVLLTRWKNCAMTPSKLNTNSKLGRSHSDLSLKRSRLRHWDSVPYTASPIDIGCTLQSLNDSKIIENGKCSVLYDEKSMNSTKDDDIRKKLEEIARSAAEVDSGNPFVMHEVYSTTRKLAFEDHRKRGSTISEQSGDGIQADEKINLSNHSDLHSADSVDARSAIMCTKQIKFATCARRRSNKRSYTRRCSSLPCLTASSYKTLIFAEEFIGAVHPCTSADAKTFAQNEAMMYDEVDQRAIQGRMTMTFKNEDQKFNSRHHASRRHTVMDASLLHDSTVVSESLSSDFSITVDETMTNCDTEDFHLPNQPRNKKIMKLEFSDPNVVLHQPLSVKTSLDSSSQISDEVISSGERVSPSLALPMEDASFDWLVPQTWTAQSERFINEETMETIFLNDSNEMTGVQCLDNFCIKTESCAMFACEKQTAESNPQAKQSDSVVQLRNADGCAIL